MKFIPIIKTDAAKRIALGIVYEPMKRDSQSDFATAETIEKASHEFISSGRIANIDVAHDGRASGARVVESFIQKDAGNKDFPIGAWVMGVQTPDAIWQDIVAGRLNGFSLSGTGTRTEKALAGKTAHEIRNLIVTAVSLVHKAANRRNFAMLKSDDTPAWAQELLAKIDMVEDRLHGTEQTLDGLDKGHGKKRARTSDIEAIEKEHLAKSAIGVRQLVRKLEVLSGRLEKVWEGEFGTDSAAREREMLAKIESVEIELEALRKSDDSDGIFSPKRSAFFQRGGGSFVVDAGEGVSSDSAFAPKSDALRKAENEVDLDSDLKI